MRMIAPGDKKRHVASGVYKRIEEVIRDYKRREEERNSYKRSEEVIREEKGQ